MKKKYRISIERSPDIPIEGCCEAMQFEIKTNRIAIRGDHAYINAGGYQPPNKLTFCPYCGSKITMVNVIESIALKPDLVYYVEDDNGLHPVKSIGVIT